MRKVYGYFSNVFVFILFVTSIKLDLKLVRSESTPFVVDVWDIPLTNNTNSSLHDELNIFDDSANKEIPENCSKALELFSEKVTDLTRCTILNARPVRICTKCESKIKAVHEVYNRSLKVKYLLNFLLSQFN